MVIVAIPVGHRTVNCNIFTIYILKVTWANIGTALWHAMPGGWWAK